MCFAVVVLHCTNFCHPGAVNVECTIAADDYVMGVKLVYENGIIEDLTINHDGKGGWNDKKTVSFRQSHINEQAALMIHAEDSNKQDHCYLAGLLVHCIASDTRSPWNNFLTNINNWYSEDGKKLCSNNNAAFLGSNVDWISNMTDNGANHIWVAENQVVNLIGTPWNDFSPLMGNYVVL